MSVCFLDAKTAFGYAQFENSERLVRAFALNAAGTDCAPVLKTK
jgi:hypothetical protein